MKRVSSRLVLSLILAGLALPAGAYYDDVHYGLTYYIARQTGFTHWQAYRIASACSRVDYDEDTEPVQVGQQLADAFSPLGGDVHASRTYFHAFRYDGGVGQRVIHQEDGGAAAQQKVMSDLQDFFQKAIQVHRNPGAYLHALQDVTPHYGYGSQWGHNPGDSEVFDRVLRQRLPIGSTTDWVSFRPNDVQRLCQTTHAHLTPFMEYRSPHQKPRAYSPQDFSPLVTALAAANPHPEPLTSDAERLQFMYVAMSDRQLPIGFILALFGGEEPLRSVTTALKNPAVANKMNMHLRGPNLERGYEEIDRALEDAGFAERLPRYPIEYDLRKDGSVAPSQLDNWVLVGNATLSIRGTQAVTARLLMDQRDASGKIKRTPLNIPPVLIRVNSSHSWKNLPIGDIYAELTRQHGPPITVRMGLNRRAKSFGPIAVGGPPLPRATRLPAPGKRPTPVAKQPPKPRPESIGNFGGEWDSFIAAPFRIPIQLTLSQSGSRVNGTYKLEGRYTQAGKDVTGVLEGTAKGNVYTFKWKDNFGAKGTGVFTLKADGKEFSGVYGSDDAKPSRLWNAVRK